MKKRLIEKFYSLNENEFIMLAGSCGIKELHGFEMKHNEKGELDEEQVKRTIISLCKKNILCSLEEGFKMNQELKNLFNSMKNYRQVIMVEYSDEELAPVCIYVGDDPIVYVRPATDGVDYVHIGGGVETELSKFLAGSDLLPEGEKNQEINWTWEDIEGGFMIPEHEFESLPNRIVLITIKDVITKTINTKLAVIRYGTVKILLIDSYISGRSAKLFHKAGLIESICNECEEVSKIISNNAL